MMREQGTHEFTVYLFAIQKCHLIGLLKCRDRNNILQSI